MREGFRQSMAWLHTWGGLVVGWVLMAIVLTGTLSVFAQPITQWMMGVQASRPVPVLTSDQRAGAIRRAQRHLAIIAPLAPAWEITLPSEAEHALTVRWADSARGEQIVRFDALTGSSLPALPVRRTEGGQFFVVMHYELHAGMAGFWVVGFATMGMLVAIVTGVIIHKRIFKDFFVLRLGKGQRTWLDAHNVSSVLTLPFQIMIAYTGLAIFYYAWMPAAIGVYFGLPGGIAAQFEGTTPYFEALAGHAEPPPPRMVSGPLMPLDELLSAAETRWRAAPTIIIVTRPAGPNPRVEIHGAPVQPPSRILPPAEQHLVFNGATGALLEAEGEHSMSGPVATQAVMSSLHQATFGGTLLRWLYFLSGLASTAMVATGLVLFTAKRRRTHARDAATGVYAAIERVNVAAIAGLAIACAAYLWASRLIPVDAAGRVELESDAFFLVWLATLVHALARPGGKAWSEQFAVAGLLCLGLPFLNIATTGDNPVSALARHDLQTVGVELTSAALGIAMFYAALRSAKRQLVRPAAAAAGAAGAP